MRQQEIANRWGQALWRHRTLSNTMLAAAVVGLFAFGPRAAHGISVERVSVTTDGTPADGSSLNPRTNADGTVVVFQSAASNLVPDDRNGHVDVFVVDLSAQPHTTERVSRSHLDGDPNDNSFPAVLSHDGRFVAYGSAASNIVVGDFNSLADVFIYDRESLQTQILSLSQDGFGGGAVPDLAPAISEDGVHTAFASQADNLAANDANEASDIFVHDTSSGANEIVTYTSLGGPQVRTGNGPSAGPSISDDGCVVAFFSDASDLVPGDTNQARDVFVRDRCSGSIERASVTSAGEQAQGPSQLDTSAPAVSADGRYIVFSSKAPNLDGANGSTVGNIFLRDRSAGTTTLVSKAQDGTPGNGLSQWGSVSADGRFVAFQSLASNLIADDTNGRADIFVVDMLDGEVRRASVTASGEQSDGDSANPQLSSDGTRVVFQSSARLTPDDNDDFINIFVAENPLSGKPVPASPTPTPSETAVETPTETPSETPTQSFTGGPDDTPTPTFTARPGIATVSPTPTVTDHNLSPTPTRTATTRRTPTATRTTTSSTPGTGGNGGGGGGGCGCRVDPLSGAMVSDASWPALLLPVILWVLRRRHVLQRS